jgi:hypothetical protein
MLMLTPTHSVPSKSGRKRGVAGLRHPPTKVAWFFGYGVLHVSRVTRFVSREVAQVLLRGKPWDIVTSALLSCLKCIG